MYHPACHEDPDSHSILLAGNFRINDLAFGLRERGHEVTLFTGKPNLLTGNIGSAQDFETIVEVAAVLRNERNIDRVIVGDGRMQAWVEQEIARRDLQDTVHLVGRHPVESMSRFFARAYVMVVTLRKEPIFAMTIPSKVQSYLACGRPILAALDGEGARVVEESGAGVTVAGSNVHALAEAVIKLYRMPAAEREAMGRRGRHYIEQQFDRNVLLRRLENWMREIIGSRGDSMKKTPTVK